MTHTTLLPPATATHMAWAMTGAHSNDKHSKDSAEMVTKTLDELKQQAKTNPDEYSYVLNVIGLIEACDRSLDIVHKGRQLNFEENEKLRSTYLDAIKESIEFGEQIKDFLKSLPMMTVGAASGVTLAELLNLDGLLLWSISLTLAAAGYLVNMLIVRRERGRTQRLYVQTDYERDLYYDQYLHRASSILTTLYRDADQIHKNTFGDYYPIDGANAEGVVTNLLSGARPTFCQYVHKHIRMNRVDPNLWTICETGIAEVNAQCPFWEREPLTS